MRRGDLAWAVGLSLAAAVVAVLGVGIQWALAAYLAAAVATGPLVVIDARHHRLPNVITLPAYPAIAALLLLAAIADGSFSQFGRALLAGAVTLLGFALLHLINASGLGLGDVKLAGPLGMLLGWLSWPAVMWGVFAGFAAAAAWSIVLLATGQANRKSHIAFGPFMLIGLWLTVALAG